MSKYAITLHNRIEELRRLEEFVNEFVLEKRLPDCNLFELNLVLEEIFTNIVFYAFKDGEAHDILITIEQQDSALCIRVEDDGMPFDPTLREPPPDIDKPLEERDIGGLGIHLVRNLMQEVSYRREGDRNILTLIRKL
ncbi:MAG TPA: ATP-binding protein [Bacteroidales bacterium]|nr:ATP-binding protein [Bacteroidales bacterium]